MDPTTTASPTSSRGRAALSVITAGIAGGAILVGLAFAIDAVGGSPHAPTSGVVTSAPAMPSGASAPAYSADGRRGIEQAPGRTGFATPRSTGGELQLADF